MNIYQNNKPYFSNRNTKIARKVYIKHNGPIPKDETGRSYEIHHLDGDHSNNSPNNLKAVTIQEHYDIHYSQGDYGACYFIAIRMNKTPEELSKLGKSVAIKRIEEGTHPWKDSEKQRAVQKKRVRNGTHQFLNPEFQREMSRRGNKKQLENGTHPFMNKENIEKTRQRQKRLIDSGEHCFKDPKWQKERCRKALESGRHNFLGPNSPTQLEWTCSICNKKGKNKGMYTRWHGSNCRDR